MGRAIQELETTKFPEFRSAIRQKMRENNIEESPSKLASHLGIQPETARQWFHGIRLPHLLEQWQALVRGFKTTADFFLFGEEEERIILQIEENEPEKDGMFHLKIKPIRVRGRKAIQSIRIEKTSPNIVRWIALDNKTS